ncbi:hypothetical protein DCAR_0726997 [Daucus carota subsp. sativus]|uniref:Uncharacterized protein n=1 Tax=Daucus carota subsp. sativus TaxID=79200 RepID=A0A164SNY5_DAUCS|nr:hypothetical protein DCAR_0726997 [Daucus carota subsp. sativus]
MASALQQHILTAPYGSWASPITSDLVLASGKTLGGFTLGSNANLLWLESRPSESGDIYKRTCVAGANSSLVESPTEPKWSFTGKDFICSLCTNSTY